MVNGYEMMISFQGEAFLLCIQKKTPKSTADYDVVRGNPTGIIEPGSRPEQCTGNEEAMKVT